MRKLITLIVAMALWVGFWAIGTNLSADPGSEREQELEIGYLPCFGPWLGAHGRLLIEEGRHVIC